MLKIFIGNHFFLEKKYIIEVLFEEFLFFKDYKIIKQKVRSGILIVNSKNNKKILFKDFFFERVNGKSYLKKKYLPSSPKNYDFDGSKLSFPYGIPEIKFDKNEIICSIDVFASSFFLLTRWEEYVIGDLDMHKRFKDENAWLVKNKLYQKPLVNEYADLISSLLSSININIKKNKKFTPIITHDVDLISRYDSLKKIARALIGDLLLRKSLNSFLGTIKDVFLILLNKKNDPYHTFDYIMNLSESINTKSNFYFIPGIKSEYDIRYNYNENKVKKIYNKIHKRGHNIGFHPSYSSFLDIKQLKKEKERLEHVTKLNVSQGRQHYLRINLPDSWSHWESIGLDEDSSVGFSKLNGFRSGTCNKYSVFNFLKREKLNLKENPLIVMEVSSNLFYQNPTKLIPEIENLINQVKKHQGNFTFLWHNNSFFTKEHYVTYQAIINLLK